MSNLSDLFVSWKSVDPLFNTVSIPKFDLEVTPTAMIQQGDLSTKVDNLRTRISESPVFKWQSSGNTDKPYTNYSKTEKSLLDTRNDDKILVLDDLDFTKDFIKLREGFRSSRYKDAGGKSIGYGFYGTTYWDGNTITRELADKVLDGIIEKQELILSKFDVWLKLNNNLKTALHSYMYNVGSGRFSEDSEMGRALSSGNLQKIHDAINITTSQGKRNEGLVRRRELEKQLFKS